ncbi:MAG TPA: hypothetical protein VF575_01430 [Candidatus Saccharimonadales bacterium]|jgi:hypothetical protein
MNTISNEQGDISRILIPYTEFDSFELAYQLHSVVAQSTDLLLQRNLEGVIARYSRLDEAENKIRKGQAEHRDLGHFAVVNADGDVKGSASIYPGLPLKRQRIPLPPRIAISPLSKTFGNANPNIHAWTSVDEEELLASAYKELLLQSTGGRQSEFTPKAWTVEPAHSSTGIHAAIATSGLKTIGRGRYDDGESRTKIPKISVLYANVYSEWGSRHGAEKELSKGSKSFVTLLDEGNDDVLSRNPHG